LGLSFKNIVTKIKGQKPDAKFTDIIMSGYIYYTG